MQHGGIYSRSFTFISGFFYFHFELLLTSALCHPALLKPLMDGE